MPGGYILYISIHVYKPNRIKINRRRKMFLIQEVAKVSGKKTFFRKSVMNVHILYIVRSNLLKSLLYFKALFAQYSSVFSCQIHWKQVFDRVCNMRKKNLLSETIWSFFRTSNSASSFSDNFFLRIINGCILGVHLILFILKNFIEIIVSA